MKEFFGLSTLDGGSFGFLRPAEGAWSWQHILFVVSILALMFALAIFFGKKNKDKNRIISFLFKNINLANLNGFFIKKRRLCRFLAKIVLLQLLDEGSASLVLNVVKRGEVGKALVVGFKNRGRLNPLNAILRKIWGHLVKNQRCDTLVLIVRTHRNQQ